MALLAVAMMLGWVIPLAVQLWDRLRMTPAERERVWGSASWGSALVAWSFLSMLGWYWVTRRRTRDRYLYGPLSLAAVLAVSHTLLLGLQAVVGEPLEGWAEGYLTSVIAI